MDRDRIQTRGNTKCMEIPLLLACLSILYLSMLRIRRLSMIE